MENLQELNARAWQASRKYQLVESVKLFEQLVAEYPDSKEAVAARQYLAGFTDSSVSIERARATAATAPAVQPIQLVRVVDLDISFGSLVWLMVKAVIASVPAMIILAGVIFVLGIAGVGAIRTLFPYGFTN